MCGSASFRKRHLEKEILSVRGKKEIGFELPGKHKLAWSEAKELRLIHVKNFALSFDDGIA